MTAAHSNAYNSTIGIPNLKPGPMARAILTVPVVLDEMPEPEVLKTTAATPQSRLLLSVSPTRRGACFAELEREEVVAEFVKRSFLSGKLAIPEAPVEAPVANVAKEPLVPDTAPCYEKPRRNNRPSVAARQRRAENAEITVARHLSVLAQIEANPHCLKDPKVVQHLERFDHVVDKAERLDPSRPSRLRDRLERLNTSISMPRFLMLRMYLGSHVVVPNHPCENVGAPA